MTLGMAASANAQSQKQIKPAKRTQTTCTKAQKNCANAQVTCAQTNCANAQVNCANAQKNCANAQVNCANAQANSVNNCNECPNQQACLLIGVCNNKDCANPECPYKKSAKNSKATAKPAKKTAVKAAKKQK